MVLLLVRLKYQSGWKFSIGVTIGVALAEKESSRRARSWVT